MAVMEEATSVDILIPACNEEAWVGGAIASVHAAFAAVGRGDYEIVVCDNGSTDATARVAEEAGARVVREPHRQIARARNAAARAGTAPWLIWLDADSRMDAPLLRATLERMRAGGVCGGGAPVVMEGPEMTSAARAFAAAWNATARLGRLAAGSYVFARRGGWEAAGGFDEGLYAGEELAFAARLKGWGRRRGLRFVFLRGVAVRTSARKMGQFTAAQVLRQMLVLALPGNLRRRDRCPFWYERRGAPAAGETR